MKKYFRNWSLASSGSQSFGKIHSYRSGEEEMYLIDPEEFDIPFSRKGPSIFIPFTE